MFEKPSVLQVEDEVVLRWVVHYREAEEEEEEAAKGVGSLRGRFRLIFKDREFNRFRASVSVLNGHKLPVHV